MRTRTLAGLSLLLVLVGGCAPFNEFLCAPNCQSRSHNSSSLVGFLYPNGGAPPPSDATPELPVPLRVGLAFLPSQSTGRGGPTAAQQEELMERIRARFASRRFVSEITVIPSYYLAGTRGFDGLEGVQRLYNVDVMALVSYDQVANSGDMKIRSLAYLTIVGAFVVEGSEHDMATLVDLAVVDPKTRSLVLRAGGTDNRHNTSTLIDADRKSRGLADDSFSRATNEMIDHFDAALVRYETEVHEGTARVRIVSRNGGGRGGSGGGAFDGLSALLLAAVPVLRSARARRRVRSA